MGRRDRPPDRRGVRAVLTGAALLEEAAALDAADVLAAFRERFVIADETVYLDGNSLGRLPRNARDAVLHALDVEWGRGLVRSWEGWIDLAQRAGDTLAPLIGAASGEVVLADQTSVNLYKLASGALEHVERSSILTDQGNFPSDRYVLAGVASDAGGSLVVVPDADPGTLEAALDESIGLVALSHVDYRTGAVAEAGAVTALAHRHGALVLWDLAHSAGAVPVDLAGWGADLAVGCTYKYLCGGPGAPGFLAVRGDLHGVIGQPINGWFGHADQFAFDPDFTPAPDVRRYLVGTPPILSMVAAVAGIEVVAEAGMDAIHRKSVDLGELFIRAFDALCPGPIAEVASPRDPSRRGAHVAIRHPRAGIVSAALRQRGVVPDFRTPDIIRFGFSALTTTHREVVRAVLELAMVLEDEPRDAATARVP